MQRLWLCLLALAVALPVSAQRPAPGEEKKHILYIGQSMGFAHDAVTKGFLTLAKIGEESGLWDMRFRTDVELLTKQQLRGNRKNLDYFDAIVFYSQGDLPLTEQQKADIISFVKEDGKGLIAAHSGTDSFRGNWPEYIQMVGGAFNHHPWHQEVRVINEDPEHPIMRHLPPSFKVTDEIYQLNRYNRDRVRVLARLDPESVDLTKERVERTDEDFALVMLREYGKGRVFTNLLGHRDGVWEREDMQKLWLEGVKWALGLTDGPTAPRTLPSE